MQQHDLLYQPGIAAQSCVVWQLISSRLGRKQLRSVTQLACLPAQPGRALMQLCIFACGYHAGTAPRTSEHSSPRTKHRQQYKHVLALT